MVAAFSNPPNPSLDIVAADAAGDHARGNCGIRIG
jgi:hypothetical protein